MTPQESLRRALLNDEFPEDTAQDRLFTPSGADALRTNRNIALSAWMTQVSGQDINAGSATWQHDKDALTQGFFKLPTAQNVSDEQLHGLVKSHIQTAEEAATLAADGALTGESLPMVMDAVRGKRGASQLRPIFGRYEQDAMRRHTALSIKLAPYRALVNQVSENLGKEMGSTLPTTDKFQAMAERLLSVPAEDRPLVLKAIGATGGKDAKERASYLSKLAGAMGRMTETMGGSVESMASRLGGTLQELSDAPAAIAGLLSGGTSLQGEAATAKARSEESAAMRDKIDNLTLLTQQIRATADQEIDPIKGAGWWSQTGIDIARMIPQSAVTIANPALGMAANWAYFEDTIAGDAMMQDPRLTPDQARSIAGVSAPLNAAVETVTALIPFGRVKLPFVQKWLQSTATSVPTAAARLGVRAAVGTAAEVGEEWLQSYLPLKTQELLGALQKDMPGVDWENRMPKFADIAAQTWGPALIFSLVGAGSVSISEMNSGRALAMDRDLMIATGIAPAKADSIAKKAEANNWRVVDAEFRDIVDKPAVATDAEKSEATGRYLEKIKAQQQTEMINTAEAASLGVRVFRDSEGWKVETAAGSVVSADSAEAARSIRDDIRTVSTEYEAETMTALVDDLVKLQPKTRVELRPEVAAATGEGIEFTDPITGKTTKISDAKSFQNLRDQAAAIDGETSDASRLILGDNYFEFGEGIARVFRRARGPESVPQAITAAHEVIENSFRRGLLAGQWTEQDARGAIGALIPALESGIMRLGAKATAEEKSWLDNAKRAVAEGDSNLVREVISEMGVRAWIGRDRDGKKTGLRPGTIIRALDAAILQEAKPENVTTYQRLRAWFKAVGAYLKGVVATAKIIRDAERNGTIDDFTGFLDKVLGIEAATREESEVKQDVQNMAFSLAPEMQSRAQPLTAAPIVEMPDGARLVGPSTFSIQAYHGTPHKVDKFTTAKIGTGEGAQAYGWGLYFAESQKVAADYQKALSGRQYLVGGFNVDHDNPVHRAAIMAHENKSRESALKTAKTNLSYLKFLPESVRNASKTIADENALKETIDILESDVPLPEVTINTGNLYTVELLPDADQFLDWDRPLSEQSEKVKAAIQKAKDAMGDARDWSTWSGMNIHAAMELYSRKEFGEMRPDAVSKSLASIGIPGIRYADGQSRVSHLEIRARKVEVSARKADVERDPSATNQSALRYAEQALSDLIRKDQEGTRNYVIFDESLVRILEENGKPVGSTFSLAPTERDREYLADVEAGDLAKSQRLVNKAARDAGTVWEVGDGKMYHGTRSEFEVMRTPAFFSPNPEVIYDQQQENKQHDYGDKIKPFFLFGKVKYGVEMPEYTWGVRSVEDDRITAAEDEGYDIVELVPYGDTSGGENSFFVAINPSAIKSADPVTRDESGQVIPLSQRFNTESNDIRFSLSPQSGIDIVSDTLESWQGVFDAAAKRNPSRAMAIRNLAQQRINKLGENWAADRWTAKGDKIRAVVEKRTKGSLDDELAMREALLEGEKIAANMEASQAKREAKAEAAEWRQEADDMQADDWSPRESLVRDMRVLNVALSAFPPEVRAKVTGGSMVKLAGLATERARYKAIKKALDKAIVETEVFMKKEYTEQVDKALDSYRSQKDSGGRISGKLPSQYTELVDYAARIRDAKIEDQATEAGGLEKALEESESDQQTQTILEKMGILRLFEAWDLKDSVAMAAANEWLSDTIESGKLGRKLLDEDRKAMLDDFRATAKKDAVPEGKISKVDVDNETNQIRFKTFRRAGQMLNGAFDSAVHTFLQRLELVFGEDSKIVDHFIMSFIGAANASNDIKRGVNTKFHDILSVVFNSRSRLAHARGIGQMQKVKASGVMITEGRNVEETKLDTETLTKLSDGTMTAEAAGLRQDQVDAALEEFAANPRKRTVTVETVKNAGEQKEKQMTELQGIQWLLWSRQTDSRKQMERDGWTEESFKQLDAFLSPEAKTLGEWIASSYDDAARLIDPVYRRLFRAPLPLVKNYAPIYRTRSGDASVMDLDASDISSGLAAGFTKSRVNTVSPLAEMDAVTVMLTHWENVAHWVTHAEAVRDAKAVLLDRDVMTAIKQTSGNVSANSIKQRIAAIESQGTKAARELHDLNRIWRWLMQYRAFKGLAFRLSPIIKQTPALLNPLLADVPAHSYTIGLARAFYDPAAFARDVSAMFESDVIQRRIEGGFSAEARIAMQGEGAAGSVALAWMQRGMMPMAWTDGGWTAIGAAVSFDYYRRGYLSEGMNETQANAAATKRLEKMIATSAQPSDIVNRSLVEASSNGFMRAMWMFASDPRKALGIEVTALKKLLSGKSKNKAMDVQRILVAHAAQAAMSQLMASWMASLIGDDDDKEREWSREQWTLSLTLGPINGLFVLGRLLDMTGRRILNMKAVQEVIGTGVKLPIFANKTLAEQTVNDAWNAATSIDNIFNPEDSEDLISSLENIAVGASGVMSMGIGPQAGVVDVTANLLREGEKIRKAMAVEE